MNFKDRTYYKRKVVELIEGAVLIAALEAAFLWGCFWCIG